MELLAAAGVAGIAGYALGKRKERRQVENGYITYREDEYDSPEYGTLHYGKTARHHGDGHRQSKQSSGHHSHHAHHSHHSSRR